MTDRRRITLLTLGLVALALGLRLYGLGWGLPAVYEEAYPFKKSWQMWGWGPTHKFDPNPHFFNYPTLFFYVQFLGQALLLAILRLAGEVHSILDYRVLYALDKTPFYLLGRGISALFGAATVLITFGLGRRVAGTAAGVAAAVLVAINQPHIAKSQFIEVDVPMTALATLCALFAVRILEKPARRVYLLAGLFGGLATSTKYNGALLCLPILLAHIFAVWRRPEATGRSKPSPAPTRPQTWRWFVEAAVVFAAAFAITSPYILLDRANFWTGFNYERLHMQIGHFGLDDTPAFLFYMRVFSGNLLGWPFALLALAGFVWLVAIKRRPWAAVLAIFPIVYIGLISSWSMKAERYMLPVLPVAAVFAAAFVAEQVERLRARRAALPATMLGLATIAMAIPSLAAYQRDLIRLRGDTRTLAKDWIEKNVPAASFILEEPYGPEPLGVIDLQMLDEDVRTRIRKERPETRVYAIQTMPMYQVRPENSAIFYQLGLYDEVVDCIVTSSSVVSRYRKNPALFQAQNAFYDSLALRWTKAKEFGPEDGSGPRIVIYRNPHGLEPFGKRRSTAFPPMPAIVPDALPGAFSAFFDRQGFLFESFGYQDGATALYLHGLRYDDQPPEAVRPLVLGAIRTSLAAGRQQQALAILEQAEKQQVGGPAAYWRQLRAQFTAAAPRDSTHGAARRDSTPAGTAH